MSASPKPRRPHVLVLATTFSVSTGDGTPDFVRTLAQLLSDAYEITVVVPRVPNAARREQAGDIRIERFAYFPRRWEGLADGAILSNLRAERWRLLEVPCLLAAMWVTAARVAKRERPDLIHAHWLVPAGAIAFVISRRIKIPYVVTVHGADVYALPGRFARMIRWAVIRKAAAVLPTSREMAAIIGLSDRDSTRWTIPMGVDVAGIARAVGQRSPHHGRFLFVGRLEEKKGVDILLSAIAAVPDAQLTIVGDGRLAGRLRTLAENLKVLDRVTFLGRQPHDRVVAHLRTAYALVVPSRVADDGDSETTPLVMSEAMAAGVPVLASRLGGLAERITHRQNGLLFEPASPEALADVLRYSLTEVTLLTRCADAARQQIGDLDLFTTRQRYDTVFQEAIGAAEGYAADG